MSAEGKIIDLMVALKESLAQHRAAESQTLPAPLCWCGEDATHRVVVTYKTVAGKTMATLDETHCEEHAEKVRGQYNERGYDVEVTAIGAAS